jgi:hypothetical protein
MKESNRQPDVRVINIETRTTVRIGEAERVPGSPRNQQREADYNYLGIPNETME